ncbi:MAG: hypothetical protein PUB42_01890, partial [Firmicutes bacterium]|nr:hypothetical protein [Bacillota bacterium]
MLVKETAQINGFVKCFSKKSYKKRTKLVFCLILLMCHLILMTLACFLLDSFDVSSYLNDIGLKQR